MDAFFFGPGFNIKLRTNFSIAGDVRTSFNFALKDCRGIAGFSLTFWSICGPPMNCFFKIGVLMVAELHTIVWLLVWFFPAGLFIGSLRALEPLNVDLPTKPCMVQPMRGSKANIQGNDIYKIKWTIYDSPSLLVLASSAGAYISGCAR